MGAAGAALLCATSAGADPVTPYLSACFSQGEWGDLAANNQGSGFGNTPNDRRLLVSLAYCGDAAALANTHRIELCLAAGLMTFCPGTGNFLLYDDSPQSPKGNLPLLGDLCVTPSVGTKLYSYALKDDFVDWHDAGNADLAVVVSVNGQPPAPATQGACLVPSVLASDGRFEIVAYNKNLGTFPIPGFDVCATPPPAGGTKLPWRSDGSGWWSGCLDTSPSYDQATWALRLMDAVDDGQWKRIQGNTFQVITKHAWWNGGGPLQPNPSHILLGAQAPVGAASDGGFKGNSLWLAAVNPTLPPYASTPGQSHGSVQTSLKVLAHEFTHKLLSVWGRDEPAFQPIFDYWMLSEALPTSIEYNECLFDLPGMPPQCTTAACCMTAGRADPTHQKQGIFSTAPDLLHWPQSDLLHQQYSTAAFWRYAYEQFGYPSGTNQAHPKFGTASKVERPGVPFDCVGCELGKRFPDEGTDLLGLLLDRLANPGAAKTTVEVTNDLLTAQLGRSLADVAFDFHTALYLKDYHDAGDARWRLDWVGDYTSQTLLDGQKSVDPPNDLYGTTKYDQLVRGYRILDGWGTCQPNPNASFPTCTKNPLLLLADGGRASVEPAGLAPWGVAVASVLPDPLWAALQKPLAVRAWRAAPSMPLPRFRIFKAFLSSFDSASETDRVLSMRLYGIDPLSLPSFAVEPNVTELRVTAVSSDSYTQLLRLVDPSGVVHLPTASTPDGTGTVFRIPAPSAGGWMLSAIAAGPFSDEPSVLIDVSVRGRARLYASADIAAPVLPPAPPFDPFPYDDGRTVGSDVLLLAAPTDLAPIAGCSVYAQITPPSGAIAWQALFDDGQHGDQRASDGVYAARFTETGEPGLYSVRLTVYCFGPTGEMLQRDRHLAFALHSPTDTDGDGLYDAWEVRYGLNPNDALDGAQDPDHDGLSNLEELRHATDPWNADTDSGGENDGSEVAAWLNPRDGTDDRLRPPSPALVAGNQRALLSSGIALYGLTLDVEIAPTLAGPYQPMSSTAFAMAPVMQLALPNDQNACVRVRARVLVGGSTAALPTSGWSQPQCVVPRLDPDPPHVEAVEVERVPFETRLVLSLDDTLEGLPEALDVDRGVTASGVAALRFDTAPSFEAGAWQAVGAPGTAMNLTTGVAMIWEPTLRLLRVQSTLPTSVHIWVQLQDAAGNVSEPRAIAVQVEGP